MPATSYTAWWAFVTLALGLMLSCSRRAPGPIDVTWAGCDFLWQPSQTEYKCQPTGERLIVGIHGQPETSVSLERDAQPVGVWIIPPTGELTIPLDGITHSQQLTLLEPTQRFVWRRLSILKQVPFDAAKSLLGRIPLGSNCVAQRAALDKLRDDIAAMMTHWDPAERGYAHLKLGEYQAECGRRDEALETYHLAYLEARSSGLHSVAALSCTRYAAKIYEQQGVRAALAILQEPQDEWMFLANPPMRFYRDYHALNYLLESGLYVAARRLTDTVKQYVDRYELHSDPATYLAMQYLRTRSSFLEGKSVLADQTIEQVTAELPQRMASTGNPSYVQACQTQLTYRDYARMRLLGRETGLDYQSPDSLLERAEALGSPCKGTTDEIPSIWSMRARSRLLGIEWADPSERARAVSEAEALLNRSRQQFPTTEEIDPEIQVDWLVTSGKAALLSERPQVALDAYSRLSRFTGGTLEPFARWTALVGQAEAYRQLGERGRALEHYERAERMLDSALGNVALLMHRQIFVQQFADATSRYLELLLESAADYSTAWRVVRHAHARALLAHSRLTAGDNATPEQRDRLDRHAQLVAERERLRAEVQDAPLNERAAAERRLRDAEQRLSLMIESLYQPGSNQGAETVSYAPLGPQELAVTCHPAPSPQRAVRWVCLAADSRGVYVVRDVPWSSPSTGVQFLLEGLAEPLRRAKVLRLLPYGPMRDIEWERVPWQGEPLGTRFDVLYSIDRPERLLPVPQHAHQALVVLDPEEDLAGGARLRAAVPERMVKLGWDTVVRAGSPRRGGGILRWLSTLRQRFSSGPMANPATATEVRNHLPSANLFFYYGHAEAGGTGGWDGTLRLASNERLTVRDIIALPSVPRLAFLFGCETAVSGRDAPSDEVGLAQGFLLRGSEVVLATTRKVTDASAEKLAQLLMQDAAFTAGKLDRSAWTAALHRALRSLRHQQPHEDWAAFRVYVP